VLHGGGGYPSVMRWVSRMDEVAERQGFIVVYPAGTGPAYDRNLHWNSGAVRRDPRFRDVDDVGFVAAALDDAAKYFSVDRDRVYASGISNGGQMAFRLGAELSDPIAAVGSVCGDRTLGQFFPPPPRPVPVIAFHGRRDRFLPFGGGRTPLYFPFAVVDRPPVVETIAGWVRAAGGQSDVVEISHKGQATLYHYPPVDKAGTDVDFWALEDGGHTWPGGRDTPLTQLLGTGVVNQDISASELMWAFFARHRLTRDGRP
jgi:polyhydroxybutyrate depolymerase